MSTVVAKAEESGLPREVGALLLMLVKNMVIFQGENAVFYFNKGQ